MGDRLSRSLLPGHNGVAVIDRIRQGPLDAEIYGPLRAEECPAIEPKAFQGFLPLVQPGARVVTKDACQDNRIGV